MAEQIRGSRFALKGDDKAAFNTAYAEANQLTAELERGVRAEIIPPELVEGHKVTVAKMKAFKAQYVD